MSEQIKQLTKDELEQAISNYIPKEPRKYELGGGYYYNCTWLACNEPLKRYMAYCPKCGQRILWDDEYLSEK